jgi:hypothetical protein
MFQSTLSNDWEYLFEPYSAFTVASVHVPAVNEPADSNDIPPIVIVLIASIDAIAPPDDLPLSPWN